MSLLLLKKLYFRMLKIASRFYSQKLEITIYVLLEAGESGTRWAREILKGATWRR